MENLPLSVLVVVVLGAALFLLLRNWNSLSLPLFAVIFAKEFRYPIVGCLPNVLGASALLTLTNREGAAPAGGWKFQSPAKANHFATDRAVGHRCPSRIVKAPAGIATLGRFVVSNVIALRGKQLKVTNSVVASLSVFVMHSLRTFKEATKVALHDKAMLKNCARLTRVGMLRASNMHVSVWGRMFTPSAEGFGM